MSRHVLLLRHGATKGGNAQRFIGHIDPPLSRTGEEQACRLKNALDEWTIDTAFCSDLVRCRQTARLALTGRDIETVARRDLREAAMGEWEGLSRSEVMSRFPEELAARENDLVNYRMSGGESFADCQARVVPAFEDILSSTTGNVMIAAHGGVNRVLLCHLLGMPLTNLFRLGQDHGCMNIVRVERNEYRVLLLNYTPPTVSDTI